MIKLKSLLENIKIPVKVGDTILTGKFKNKKTIVKTIEYDEHDMPIINGRKVVTFRIYKEPTNERQALGKTKPRFVAVGGKKGMRAHFIDGTEVKDIERLSPRDTIFRGILAKRGTSHNMFKGKKAGDEVTFAQSFVIKYSKK